MPNKSLNNQTMLALLIVSNQCQFLNLSRKYPSDYKWRFLSLSFSHFLSLSTLSFSKNSLFSNFSSSLLPREHADRFLLAISNNGKHNDASMHEDACIWGVDEFLD